MFSMLKKAALCAALLATPVFAHDFRVGELHIVHPWARATPEGAKVAGGFMKITNNGKVADKLVGGSLLLAGKFEVHEMSMSDGVMRMRQLEKGLEIPAGATIELKPGGFHVMFMDLKSGLSEGQKIKGTLIFEKAGMVEVEFKVEPVGHTPKGGGHVH